MKHILIASLALSASLAMPSAIAAEKEAIFAGGCFWCIEKDFEYVAGVKDVVSGYTGGSLKNPTYKTYKKYQGHRQAVKITYDDTKVSYEELLDTFWRTIDPTDGGGQFCDRGHSYSSAVYYTDSKEKKLAEATKKKAAKDLNTPIATAIEKASFWTDAEKYHQDYYKKKPLRYGYYRRGCGRDARVKSLWGKDAYPRVSYKN